MPEVEQAINNYSNQTNKVLLIDLENCPAQLEYLQKDLEQFAQVVICYAKTGAKIPLDWLLPLSSTINSGKLKIFKMASPGKNSADFGICFFAGVLMEQLHKETHFTIVSNDTDLDHVINLLESQGRSAERKGTKKGENKALATSEKTVDEPTTLVSPIKIYCMHLVTYSKNRPARKDTLLNSIKNKFKSDPNEAAKVFQSLATQGAINITDKKVSYNDQKIKELANK